MSKDTLFYVGLDTHKETMAVTVCEAGGAPGRFIGTLRNDLGQLLKVLRQLGAPETVSVVYEAGPTGYGLYRALRERGYGCTVIAPSLTPHRPGDRVKTDRRDSEQLARLWRAGELTPVWIPEPTEEAMRDLWRAREDARDLRLKTRRGSITKTGNAHARRLLVEAAWGYHFTARMSQALKDRNRDLPEVVQRHAWKAQERLCGRFAHLTQRGVQANKICVAVARELAGFVWAVARLAPPASSPAAGMQR